MTEKGRYKPTYDIVVHRMEPGKEATGTIDGVKFTSKLKQTKKHKYYWEHYIYLADHDDKRLRGMKTALSIHINKREREEAIKQFTNFVEHVL